MGLNLKSTSSKVLASAALLAAAAGVAGMGTYGGFTASTKADTAVKAATVKLTGGDSSTLSLAATGAIPGDTMQRAFTMVNAGDQDLTGITLTTSATASSLLDTDKTNGLQMQIDRCPVAWTQAGTAPSYTYTCVGAGNPQITTIVASTSVAGSFALSTLNSKVVNGADFLRVTLAVPSTADDKFQGQNSAINFTFAGAIRGAGAK